MPAPTVNAFVVSGIREFLEALNSGGGPPIEQLSPKDARQVQVDAQKSVQVDLSGIETSGRTIDHGGESLRIHVVRPAGAGSDRRFRSRRGLLRDPAARRRERQGETGIAVSAAAARVAFAGTTETLTARRRIR
jgi:hypothetical protein